MEKCCTYNQKLVKENGEMLIYSITRKLVKENGEMLYLKPETSERKWRNVDLQYNQKLVKENGEMLYLKPETISLTA